MRMQVKKNRKTYQQSSNVYCCFAKKKVNFIQEIEAQLFPFPQICKQQAYKFTT